MDRCLPLREHWGRLYGEGIRCFDLKTWAEPLTDAIKTRAQQLAAAHGVEIEYIVNYMNPGSHSSHEWHPWRRSQREFAPLLSVRKGEVPPRCRTLPEWVKLLARSTRGSYQQHHARWY